MACSPVTMSELPGEDSEGRKKRKADEIADSEEEDVAVGSDGDLGLPDEDFFGESNDEILPI